MRRVRNPIPTRSPMTIRLLLATLLFAVLSTTTSAAAPTPKRDPFPARTSHSQLETGIHHIEVDSRSLSATDERDARYLCDALVAQIAEEGDYEIIAWRKNLYGATEGSHVTGTSHSIIIWTPKSSKTYSEAYLRYTGKPVSDQKRNPSIDDSQFHYSLSPARP